jgi:hypothetical protein
VRPRRGEAGAPLSAQSHVEHDEKLGPDLLRCRGKSIGGDLDIDDKGSE